ncbi:ATP synthase E chain-domain-containing protein [Dipodascopsis uninucleata]
MSTLNVFRWTALGAGVLYGAVHSYNLSVARAKKHEATEYQKKVTLISKAKEEYARLHPKPVAASTATLDLADPNFDFAKYIETALTE